MKNLKKVLSLFVAAIMLISLVACSSGSTATATTDAGAEAPKKVANLTVATGGTSGTYYGFTGVIAQTLNETLGDVLNLNVVSTGASKANVQLVDQGDADLAILQNDVMSYAYNATDMFSGEAPVRSFSAIASCYPETVQIVATKNINSVADLKGKKVSVGDAGSGTEFNAIQILNAYGINPDKDITKSNQSFADSCDSLKNGTLDAAFVVAGHPTVAVTELGSSYDFNLVEVDAEHAEALKKDYPFYAPVTIEGGTYGCVADDKQTVAVMATFIASNDVSEDVVYAFTKALFEQKGDFQHAKAALLDPKTGISGIGIPFHPGAEKYYKEIGIK